MPSLLQTIRSGIVFRMSEPSLDSLIRIFSFKKKQNLVKYCRDLTISSGDFVTLVLACEMSGQPFNHRIDYRDRLPDHLVPSDSEIAALESTPAGSDLKGEAAKAVSKMSQSFIERRYLVGHLFFQPYY